MPLNSAGILLFKFAGEDLLVLLVHPGGPLWAKKDVGSWSIPKGLFEENESPLQAAKREFKEETGFDIDGDFIDLGQIKQPSGKIIHTFALQHDIDVTKIQSNLFSMEWPKNSGQIKQFPEIDKAQWFTIEDARKKILKGQALFLDRLIQNI